MKIQELSSEELQDALYDANTFIFYYAEYHDKSKEWLKILENFADNLPENYFIYKIDVDENPDIAEKNEIVVIPTLVLYVPVEIKLKLENKDNINLETELNKINL